MPHISLSCRLIGTHLRSGWNSRSFTRPSSFFIFSSWSLQAACRPWRFVLFFLFAFLYYPLNHDAYVIFVYPFAMLCLFVSRLRTLFLVLITMMAGVVAETWYLGRPFAAAESLFLYCVIIWAQ